MHSELTIRTAQQTKDNHYVALLGEETAQQFSLRVQDIEPGQGSPLHIHKEQSETFHVVSGEFMFKVGEQELIGKAGTTVHIPKNTPHAYLYEKGEAQEKGRLISILTPGIHDGFIKNIPEAEARGASADELSNIAKQFGAEVVGAKLTS